MKLAALILLSLLATWWVLLTVFLIWNYRKRAREAETPLTPEQKEECRRLLQERMPHPQMRLIDFVGFVIISPVLLVMLPLYLYGWLVKDPYAKQDRA
jgi:hypothetical protein